MKRIYITSLLLIIGALTSCNVAGPQGPQGEPGAPGQDGSQGPQGQQGNKGTDGTSILTGNGAPSFDSGKNGGSYIDLSTWDYYIKTNDLWIKQGNIKGQDGKDSLSLMAMFPKMAVIGDSYSVYDDNGGIGADKQLSWLTMMARRNGSIGTCYSFGGATTRNWLNNTVDGLPAMLADTPKNLYYIMLGINDTNEVALGTIVDATDDYDKNPDTYYGNYARIICNVQAFAPHSKIILVCPPMSAFNGAVVDLASLYGLPFITSSDPFFSSDSFVTKYGHPVASAYAAMSIIYERESNEAILNNPDYFNDYVCDGPLLQK